MAFFIIFTFVKTKHQKMKKNSTVQKKLRSYSAMAGTLVAAVNSADAQTIVYTDVSPDAVLGSSGVYNLDLNNDAVVDFKITQQSGLYYGYFSYDAIGVFPQAANNAVDTAVGGSPSALNINMTVDASLNWLDSAQLTAITPPTANGLALTVPMFAVTAGNFLGQNGKFLPLRFRVGGVDLYGWVRLNVAADAQSFTVIDYAYTNTPSSYSITGMMSVGIAEAGKNNQISIFSTDKNISVKLDPNVAAEGSIVVTNMIGQTITEVAINNSETFIPMETAQDGIYIVTVKQDGGSYTKRVSIR
jgi:hypothetical protein